MWGLLLFINNNSISKQKTTQENVKQCHFCACLCPNHPPPLLPPSDLFSVAMLTASSSLSAYNNIITHFNLELEGGDLICSLHALGMITHKHFVLILTVNTSIQSFTRQFCFNGNFEPLLSHEQLEHHFWSFTKHFVF